MKHMKMRAVSIPALVVWLVSLTGCDGARYVMHLFDGQLRIQTNLEPIDRVLASGRLAAEDHAKLDLIVAAREFARNEIGLKVGNSYTRFFDTGGKPLVYNLSASRKDRFEAREWRFPIAGSFPYLGFFDEAYLREVEQGLITDDWDTFVYEADAYSTLGILEDPVRSPMLKRTEISLADTIIHELLHNTIWRANHVTFNETMATFVGRTGAIQFFRARYGDSSALPELAQKRFEDGDRINAFLAELYNELDAYYRGPLSSEEKIAGREAIYRAARNRFRSEIQPTLHEPSRYEFYATSLPVNNAFILGNYRYTYDLSLFEAVYRENGDRWPETLRVFRDAANAAGEPFEFLRTWLRDRGVPATQPAAGKR